MPPRLRNSLTSAIQNNLVSFNGLQIYTSDKEILRPSKGDMPFMTGTIAKFLAQDRKTDLKIVESMKKHGDVMTLLSSLEMKNVAIRAEMKATISFPPANDELTVEIFLYW